MPNNFAYNTKNEIYLWMPIHKSYLLEEYKDLTENSLLKLAEKLKWFWIKDWEDQIINVKCDWIDRWYPVLWIASAGSSQEQLIQLFKESCIVNKEWENYIKKIFEKMKGE